MKVCKYFIFTLLLVCALFSCKDKHTEKMVRLVKEWDGKEIRFPENSVFTIHSKDTVDFDFQSTEYKLLIYVDSIGCTSCKLQLHMWKSFIEEIESLTNGSVPFLFYFHPKDKEELGTLIAKERFDYPVCFDHKDELNKLNAFPSDITFQTFLLDKDNKVKIIGNPILNPKIRDLFIAQLTGNVSNTEPSLTEVSVSEVEHNFGSFPAAEVQEYSFFLTNQGDNLLYIRNVVVTCGCTRVEYDTKPIPPAGISEVKVTYEADQVGYFKKAIRLYCNSENSPITLKIWGESNK